MVTRRAVGLLLLALLLPACLDDVGAGLSGTRTQPLAAPGDLTATYVGGFRIRLDWDDLSTRETGHRIDVHTSPFDANTAAVVDVVYLSADATTLDYDARPNRTLYFRVLALTDALESDPSNTASASTPPSAPTPYDLKTGPVTAGEITLRWSFDGAPSGIRVERSADGGATWTGIYDAGPASAFQDSSLLPGREYTYQVFSRDSNGLSYPSVPASDMTRSTDWTVTTIATSSGTIGNQNAIAVHEGAEYVTHYDSYPSQDMHLTSGRPGSAYTTRAVDTGTAAYAKGFDGTSIAIDAAGAWHAAGCESPGYDLRYITNASRSIVASTIDAVGDTGHHPRLAISPYDASIQIVYRQGEGTLKRAIKRGSAAWMIETVTTTEKILFPPSFVFDPWGKACVLFAESTSGGFVQDLVYGTQEPNGPWVFERLGWGGITGGQSLAVDASGITYAAYMKPDFRTAKYGLFLARRDGTWTSEPVHVYPGQSVEASHALCVSPSDGRVHVAYLEHVNLDLRYATRAPGQPWTRRVIDTTGDVGWPLSMAVVDGVAHIAYHDITNGDLKRALGGP